MNEPTRTESTPGRLVFATGFAALTTAALLAVHITMKSGPDETTGGEDPGQKERVTSGQQAGHRTGNPALRHSGENDVGHKILRRRPPVDSAVPGRAAGRSTSGDREPFNVEVPHDHPRRTELAERAERIAAHARLRMDALDRKLDLSPAQRARLFPLLVRSSENYDPAMQVTGGVALSDPEMDVAVAMSGLLEPVQAESLIEHTLADKALWREIFDNLLQQLEQNTPVLADPGLAPDDPQPVLPSRPLRGNIYDLVEPAY